MNETITLPDLKSVRIQGIHDGALHSHDVIVNGQPLYPSRSQRVYNHSPDGFGWGYGGSGASQLALAILIELLPLTLAQKLYHHFKWKYIAPLESEKDFDITIDVHGWIGELNKDI